MSASSRSEASWVSGNRLIRLISSTGHARGHPLYSGREPNRAERRTLLKTLMDRPVAHVLPVIGLCDCAFETPFLDGQPLRDFALGPDANRLIHPQNRRPAWAPEELRIFLKDLAAGLASLNGIGVAHGDPALMNALIADEGGTRNAIWLDLNTVRPATEENVAIDAAGFIELCLWPSLLEADSYSPSLFAALANATEIAPDILAALSSVLAAGYADDRAGDIRAAFAEVMRGHGHRPRTDLFGDVHRSMRACLAPTYFLDQTISDLNARFFRSVLTAEQTRHRLAEEEATRLHYLRFHDELQSAQQAIAELQDWSKQLQEAARYHQQRAAEADRRSAELAGQVDRLQNLSREEAWVLDWIRRLRGTAFTAGMLFSPKRFLERWRNLLFLAKAYANEDSRTALRRHYRKDYYLTQCPDVAESGVPGLLHYVCTGYLEGRAPSETFDLHYYRERYPDVTAAGIHPWLHFVLFGVREGRYPSRQMILPESAESGGLPVDSAEMLRIDNEWPADRPLVSVVIPCFNYGSYVAQAIDSVRQQTFPNYEIIVVEGGSTDGTTPQLVQGLQSRYPDVQFIFRQGRHFAGDNRNCGIRQARGRYICCLDADDVIRPTYLEVAVFLAERYGYDLVYPSVQCFDGSEIKWLLVDASFPEIAAENQVSTCALFRRTAWEAVDGFRDWGTGEEYVYEDWDFWLRILGNGFRAKAIREPLMLYRVHGTGLTSDCRPGYAFHKETIARANIKLFEAPIKPPRRVEVVNPWANLGRLPSAERKGLLLALPFLSIGGAEKLFFTLVQGLVERGYHVSVVTTLVPPGTIKNNNRLFDPLTPSVYCLPELFPDAQFWPEFIHYLLRRYAIRTLVIAGSEFAYRMLPGIDREFPDVRVIDQLFNATGHIQNNRHYANLIDLNIVPSQALFDTLTRKYGESPEKIKIIPHGVASEVPVYRDRGEALAASGLPARSAGRFLVSFFGRLSEEKSPRVFVEIARRLSVHKDIDFCLTGEGPERAAVLELIARHHLESRVFAPGFVPDVRPLIAASDVVVVPSRLDGMPLIVLESQMAGKPVVASAVGSLPELIADGVTGYICPVGDVAAFCARIEQLRSTPELGRRMGEKARETAIARYDARKMIDAYVEGFEPEASGSGPGKTAGA